MYSSKSMASASGFKRQRNSEEKKLPDKRHQSKDFIFTNALLVDDEFVTRCMEQTMLELLGIHTVALGSAHDAIELLVTGVQFDFIVVDFDLSIINGPEFVRQIRVMGVQSKVLGMCTNLNDNNIQMFHEGGANICIGKPVDPEILREVIRIFRNM